MQKKGGNMVNVKQKKHMDFEMQLIGENHTFPVANATVFPDPTSAIAFLI